MNEDSNTLDDLLSPEELQEYNTTQYPFNLSILYNALKLKLELDPDYEVWVPLVYYKYSLLIKNKGKSVALKPHKIFINNKGDICSVRGVTPRLLTVSDQSGYLSIGLPAGKGKHADTAMVHRAIGCNFLPIKAELRGAHPKELEVNHINGIKTDFSLDNLEWVTRSGNLRHAVDTGLKITPPGWDNPHSKPVKLACHRFFALAPGLNQR